MPQAETAQLSKRLLNRATWGTLWVLFFLAGIDFIAKPSPDVIQELLKDIIIKESVYSSEIK